MPLGDPSTPLSRTNSIFVPDELHLRPVRDALKIAQRFNAGYEKHEQNKSRQGRKKRNETMQSVKRRETMQSVVSFYRPWRGLHWLVMAGVPSVETLGYYRMSLRDNRRCPGQSADARCNCQCPAQSRPHAFAPDELHLCPAGTP